MALPSHNFHRRPLPTCCTPFSSPQGRAMLMRAIQSGHGEKYWCIAEQFTTQAEPTFCGLATLSMSLNALSVDPGRIWRGVWRWFSEDMLDCCIDLEVVKEKGINFAQFACSATCNGARVESHRGEDATIDTFRDDVMRIMSTPDSGVLVVAYSRKALSQTGDGHFSPLAAYDVTSDSVLVMDVARFKYPPHWVPLSTMFDAMLMRDPSTNRSRGWYILTADIFKSSLLLRIGIAVDQTALLQTLKTFLAILPVEGSVSQLLHTVYTHSIHRFFTPRCSGSRGVRCSCRGQTTSEGVEDNLVLLLQQIENTSLYAHVRAIAENVDSTMTNAETHSARLVLHELQDLVAGTQVTSVHFATVLIWVVTGLAGAQANHVVNPLWSLDDLPEVCLLNEIRFLQRQTASLQRSMEIQVKIDVGDPAPSSSSSTIPSTTQPTNATTLPAHHHPEPTVISPVSAPRPSAETQQQTSTSGVWSHDDEKWHNQFVASYDRWKTATQTATTSAVECCSSSSSSRIPMVIHQIWLGSAPTPHKCQKWMKTWQDQHAEWKYILWTDETVAEELRAQPLVNQDLYDTALNYGMKSDILRYEILFRQGGVYVDVDFECVHSLSSLLQSAIGVEAIVGMSNVGHVEVNNGIIASVPHGQLVGECIRMLGDKNVMAHQRWVASMLSQGDAGITIATTGPGLFTRAVHEVLSTNTTPVVGAAVLVMPMHTFYPVSNISTHAEEDAAQARQRPDCLAIHHWARSWVIIEGGGGGGGVNATSTPVKTKANPAQEEMTTESVLWLARQYQRTQQQQQR